LINFAHFPSTSSILKMSDKAAASTEDKKATKPKAKSTGPKKSALDSMLAEAKAVCGDLKVTGERQLRKRPASTSAPVVKKPAKKAATKAAPKKAKAVNGKSGDATADSS
jgi:hypothetical protein